jgi:NAD(P)-dependent dehydrogenase (short-subunit alcohol dehydrogenase family)
MAQDLRGRVVVVTGGFGALGRALAAVLLERGARVALVDRAASPANNEYGDALLQLGGVDAGVPDAVQGAFDHIAERYRAIDALVNVAGGFSWEAVADGSLQTWDRMYAINLRTAVAASQAVLRHLKAHGAGRIVNVGALAALKAAAGMGAYAASKAGVMRLTESLAEELKGQGITVNAVLPSVIDTPANRADMPQADFTRWVTPQSLARIIAFLLSDDAASITGACLPVAGRI